MRIFFFAEESAADEICTQVQHDHEHLYTTDWFHVSKHCIKIMTPKISIGANRTLVHGADVIRNRLSLHPSKEDLCCIDSIIVRPRHIEVRRY